MRLFIDQAHIIDIWPSLKKDALLSVEAQLVIPNTNENKNAN